MSIRLQSNIFFSKESLLGQLFEPHPLHSIFSEHKQPSRSHLVFSSSRFIIHIHNLQFSTSSQLYISYPHGKTISKPFLDLFSTIGLSLLIIYLIIRTFLSHAGILFILCTHSKVFLAFNCSIIHCACFLCSTILSKSSLYLQDNYSVYHLLAG